MANLRASPEPKHLIIDRDQDLVHDITIPAGSYLPCTNWGISYIISHPVTGAAVITYTKADLEISVVTAGDASTAGKVRVTFNDEDIDDIDKTLRYDWKAKRTDASSEVNFDGGTIEFRR